MRLHLHTWMFLCCALPPLVQACGPADGRGVTGDRPPEITTIQAEPLPLIPADGVVAQMLVGELRSVDPDRRTVLVGTSDGTFEVAYTPDTEIVDGGRAVQGLAAALGSRVTVHYRPGPRGTGGTAIRIEVRDTSVAGRGDQ